MFSLHSWNVNGLRSVSGKGFDAYLGRFAPDILCLQETKSWVSELADALPVVAKFSHRVWHAADKAGYSGTALLSRVKPLRVLRDFSGDDTREGRVISAEFPGVWVVCAYVPNSQRELLRLDHRLGWDAAFARTSPDSAGRNRSSSAAISNCAQRRDRPREPEAEPAQRRFHRRGARLVRRVAGLRLRRHFPDEKSRCRRRLFLVDLPERRARPEYPAGGSITGSPTVGSKSGVGTRRKSTPRSAAPTTAPSPSGSTRNCSDRVGCDGLQKRPGIACRSRAAP